MTTEELNLIHDEFRRLDALCRKAERCQNAREALGSDLIEARESVDRGLWIFDRQEWRKTA